LEKLRCPISLHKEEKEELKISLEISEKATVALDIVSEKYSINKDAIMEIAPFMFHVIAAASLGQRATKLDEIDKEIESFQNFLNVEKAPHIKDSINIKMSTDEVFDQEIDAINNNKLFFMDEYDIPDDVSDISANPFSQFLKSFIDLMPEKLSGLLEVEWRKNDLPRFDITTSYLKSYVREILLVSVDDELLEKTVELVLNGKIKLKEINYKRFSKGYSKNLIEDIEKNIRMEIKKTVMEKYKEYQSPIQTDSGE